MELADRVVERFRNLWKELNISNDDFIRTTEKRHQQVVQTLFNRVRERGDIYLGHYQGLYCTGCEEYYTEKQAENGCCPIHKKPLEKLREESYFFRLSAYGEPLLRYLQEHPQFVQPDFRRNEVSSFLREGLKDLSISRTSFSWGIPVPGDARHVIYVWFDALTNYISALGWDGADGGELYRSFWPGVHLIGKDILRFHAVYWPAFLMSAGLEPPQAVIAHGWWTVEGQKMSKSLRNVVEPYALVRTYGADALRYFLLREVPFGLDGDFSHVEKYFSGLAPAPGGREAPEQKLVECATRAVGQSEAHFAGCAFHQALEDIFELVRTTNRYLDEAGPWSLHKEGRRERLATVMAHALEALRISAVLLWPVTPRKAEQMLACLGLEANLQQLMRSRVAQFGALAAGTRVRVGEPLFPRIEQERAAEISSGFSSAAAPSGPQQEKAGGRMDIIDLEHFKTVDLRVGVVKSAERVPDSKKLIVMKIDLGESQPRQVVAGIGQAYTPEQLLGKRLLVVANLKPAKIMGIESRGMVLAAGPGGEKVVLAEFAEGVGGGESVH
jgi:methionyl-tRNA synthetase